MSKSFVLTVLALTAGRLFLGTLFPITGDESYYWVWARHLDWSYVDHPPMVAWINYLFTLGSANLLALRLGLNILVLLVTAVIYLTAKKMFNAKIAFYAALLFQFTPHFSIIWLTMFVDVPLLLFWSLALYFSACLLEDEKLLNWIGLALAVGLGFLSKYSMLLFWPCFVLFCLWQKERRRWLRQREFYFSLLLSAVFLLPVVYWNITHNFASLIFHGERILQAAPESWTSRWLDFAMLQIVQFSPFLWCFVPLALVFAFKNKDERYRFLLSFSLPVWFLFLALSTLMHAWPHWTGVAYVSIFILMVAYFQKTGKSVMGLVVGNAGLVLVILAVLLWYSPGILLHQAQYRENIGLRYKISSDLKVYCQINVSASMLEFYLDRPTYLTLGFLDAGPKWGEKMYAIWGEPQLKSGEDILYFGEDNQFTRARLFQHFKTVKVLRDFRPCFIEDYINCHTAFLASGFKGGTVYP
ncbi:MAG: glycosyltransferase family 39 protein [Candidatus Margulisiibacteriota bacterium]